MLRQSLIVITLLLFATALKTTGGFTVQACSSSNEECCQCPLPSQHWSISGCELRYASQPVGRWPSPYNETCTIDIVPTCEIEGKNVPVSMTPEQMNPTLIGSDSSDLYSILSREYAAALLNTAEGFNNCTDPSEQFDSVLQKGTKTGQRITVNLKQDVIERARVLLTLRCAERSFLDTTKKEEAQWLASTLLSFNNGWLFSNESGCAVGGDPKKSLGSVRGDGNLACDVGCSWTKTPREWLESSCVEGHGHINKRKCPRWPGSTVENKTLRENTFLCGASETYSGVLNSAFEGNSKSDSDAWVDLAAEYIGASLNKEKGVCITGMVDDAMRDAIKLLHSDCPCSDSELLGQQGCVHTVSRANQEQYDRLRAILSDYNAGMFAFGDDYHNVKDPLTALEMLKGGESSECCTGGCTRDYAYYLSHNCMVHHGDSEKRIAWPGGFDGNCATIPNVEDEKDLCGYENYKILNAYTTAVSIEDQDSWTMLAQAFIVTKLNVDSGACMTNVATKYRNSDSPWVSMNMKEVFQEANKTLLSHCNSVGSVDYRTSLGQKMHTLRTVLDDFIRGNYGPGACYPNDMLAACNYLSVDINTPYGEQPVTIMPNTGYSKAQCPIPENIASYGNEESCCTKTQNYWANHNADAAIPINKKHWPSFLTSVSCDYASDVCYNSAESRSEGSFELDFAAHDIAQILHINPVRLASPYPLGEESHQEHTSYCSSNVSGTYLNTNRPISTRMIDMMIKSERGDYSRDGSLTLGQRKWIRLANAFTTAMLNVMTISKGMCADTFDNILNHIVELEGFTHSATPNTNPTFYLKNTPYLQMCLFEACQLNPEQDMPSLPKKHMNGGDLCSDGYYSVVTTLEQFSNGRHSYPVVSAQGAIYHHCYETEPPTKCDTGSNGRGTCSCVNNQLYYQTHYQGHQEEEFDRQWPMVSLNKQVTISLPKEGYFPYDFVPGHQRGGLGVHSEDFSALTCPTAYSTKDITWFDIMMAPAHLTVEDAYLISMKQIIPSWLNVFKGACMPSDVFKDLIEGTKLIGRQVLPKDGAASEMCISPSLGTRVAIDKESQLGMKLMSISRVLKSFNEGYHGSHACQDLCAAPDAPNCGDHGACVPETGVCSCEQGYTGSLCQYSECSGHGWYQGGQCICATGWSGAVCDKCGIPENFVGDVYVCMPCDVSVCGVHGEYLLDHAPVNNVSQWMEGVNIPPGYSRSGALPVIPGTMGVDCSCRHEDDISQVLSEQLRSSSTNGQRRRFKFNNKQQNDGRIGGNGRTPSRTERIIADFETQRKIVKDGREAALKKANDVSKNRIETKLSPRDPFLEFEEAYPFRGSLVYDTSNNKGIRKERGISSIAQRDLCDTESEQTVIEDFLLLCLEQQIALQTQMEESCAMCTLSIEDCQSNCSCILSSTTNTEEHEELNSELKDEINENQSLNIATVTLAAIILFGMILLGLFICCLMLGFGSRRFRFRTDPLSREGLGVQGTQNRTMAFAGSQMPSQSYQNNSGTLQLPSQRARRRHRSNERTGPGSVQRRR